MTLDASTQRSLERAMLLSIGAAIVTILLKAGAAAITGSVGFLSDALESGVNLVAAAGALVALRAAARPADAGHHFGHGKAEYLSAAVEGGMILVAAAAIGWTAIDRLLHPQDIEQPGVGLALSIAAGVVNLVVGIVLVRTGRRHRSIAVVADGRHLLTDTWTTAGVVVGIALVAVFEWQVLDPLVALVVGANIVWTGSRLVQRSVVGLLDAALPPEDVARVDEVIARYRTLEPVDFHALRTRESGRQRFVYVHLLVPPDWTVTRAHDVAERLEADIERELPGTITFVHQEPIDDPASYGHGGIDVTSLPPPPPT